MTKSLALAVSGHQDPLGIAFAECHSREGGKRASNSLSAGFQRVGFQGLVDSQRAAVAALCCLAARGLVGIVRDRVGWFVRGILSAIVVSVKRI
jgi:hypothetical protein